MGYSVKSIQYTLQGEGFWSGRGAVFLRFAGCNLWSGRGDRVGPGSCAAWCDTDFVGVDGPGGGKFDSAIELVKAVQARWCAAVGAQDDYRFVVLTGGEPTLQADRDLIYELRERQFFVAMETNGTAPINPLIGWITLSPKAGTVVVVPFANEVKVVFPQDGLDLPGLRTAVEADHWWISPMDPSSEEPDYKARRARNTRNAAEYCLRNPAWRLTTQLHKAVGIP